MLSVRMLKQSIVFTLLVAFVFILDVASVQAYDCLKRPKARLPFCQDRNEARKGHTMCSGGIRQHLMNETARNMLENLHNDLRSNVYPPAADMMLMQYNQVLEKEAQIWAEKCQLSHDKEELRFLAGRFSVGQNIASSSVYNWTNAFEQWKAANSSFSYGGKNNNVSLVRNYVQIITAETSLLGCGVSVCNSSYFYVCNYAPLMDDSNVSKPYLQSKSGSWCDSCTGTCDNVTSHLCDCFGKFCINGGKMDLQTCTCNCITEVKTYDTEHCELKCDKNGDDPRCNKSPFENSTCRSNPETAFHCPWMCDICPYAGMNYTEFSEVLPWERGLPPCTTTVKPSPTPVNNVAGTGPSAPQTSSVRTTSSTNNSGGSNRNAGSTLSDAKLAAHMCTLHMILYFTAQFLNICK